MKQFAVLVTVVFPVLTYAYPWPVKISNKLINSTVGEYRTGHLHAGVDIHGPTGTAIYPVISGHVDSVSTNIVNVRISNGDIYEYIHINPTAGISPGDFVTANSTELGTTDHENHLHLEVNSGTKNLLDELNPYQDTAKTTVYNFQLFEDGTSNTVNPSEISGNIDILARAKDAQSQGSSTTAPYSISYMVKTLDGTIVKNITNITFDFTKNRSLGWIYDVASSTNSLYYYWVTNQMTGNDYFDTSTLANGDYTLTVYADDIDGNGYDIANSIGAETINITINNAGSDGEDEFEPDDTFSQATPLLTGITQTHNIIPQQDSDWFTFTLTQASNIDIQTDGNSGGDTELSLYSSSNLSTPIQYDNDNGNNAFSRIQITLDTGTYYAVVKDFNSDNEIDNYSISFSSTPISSETPVLEYFSHTINDNTQTGNNENGDGIANIGEHIALNITLKNTGTSDVSHANGVLSTTESCITITDNNQSWGEISAGQTGEASNFGFDVGACSDDTVVTFNLAITSDEKSWHDTFTIRVENTSQPDLVIENLQSNKTSYTQQEQLSFSFSVKNRGTTNSQPVNLHCYIGPVTDSFKKEVCANSTNSGLAPQGEEAKQFTVNLDGVALGQNFVTVVIDQDNNESESDESNNESRLAFTLIADEDTNQPASVIPIIMRLLLTDD